MPGIFGIIGHLPAEQCSHLAMLMAETMRCEGFYRSSAGCVPELGVHSGFVGLKGSSDGIFANSSNTVLLAFSGECFHGPALASVDLLIRLYENEGEYSSSMIATAFSVSTFTHRTAIFISPARPGPC